MRVLTLNIWGLAWPIGCDLEVRVQSIGAALPELELDVAAFQEVWTATSRNELIDWGAAAGLSHAWFPPQGAGGLLILSRDEVSDARFERFYLRGFPEKVQHADYWGEKGFATVTLETKTGAIALVTTHLHASYRARVEDEYIGHRTGQVVQLAAAITDIDSPVIVLGDFNMQEDFEEYRVLRGLTGLRDLAAGLDRRQPTILASSPYRRKNGSKGERIDYVFHRGGVRASLVPRSIERVLDEEFQSSDASITFSDHAGLLAEFSLATGDAPAPSPDPTMIELAMGILVEGRREAERRKTLRLQLGGGESGLAVAALLFARTSIATRRRFLRACCVGSAGIAGAMSGTSFALSQFASPEELAGYDTLLRILDAFPMLSRKPG